MTKEQLLNEIVTAIRPPVPAAKALAILEWLRDEISAYIEALEDDVS